MSSRISHPLAEYPMPMYVTESFSGTHASDAHAPASMGMDRRTATMKPAALKGTYPLSGWNAARPSSAARTNTYPFIGKDQRDWNDTSMYATQGNSVARNGSELPVGIDMFTAAHDARTSTGASNWEWGTAPMVPRVPVSSEPVDDCTYSSVPSTMHLGWAPNVKPMSGVPHGLDTLPMRSIQAPYSSSYGLHGRKDTFANERPTQEITTLFLAGFPDDITEREFANMFLFARGFEASMLKYPTTNGAQKSEESADSRRANEKLRTTGSEKEMRESESHTSRNKQIIGFAKFSTREEALQARDVLNGFRIDSDRGCILKAELAKKNLHTKRSVPFVVSKHTHPVLSTRAMSMYDMQNVSQNGPMSAPAMLNSVRGMSVPKPLQSLDVYVNDPRITWNESPSSPQRTAYGPPETSPHNALGDVTRVNSPINDMVVRLESFSRNIPTYAGSNPSAPDRRSDSPSAPSSSLGNVDAGFQGADVMSSSLELPPRLPTRVSDDAISKAEQEFQHLSMSRSTCSPLFLDASQGLYQPPASASNPTPPVSLTSDPLPSEASF